jgi:nickel transport protein
MLIKRLRELLLTCAILPMLVQPVLAHSIWIVRDDNNGEFDILYGHPEEGPQSYDSIKFQGALAYDKTGAIVPISSKRKYNGVSLIPKGNIASITAGHNNGYFIRTGEDEYRNVFRPEALESNTSQVEISHTYKFTKAFFESSGLVSQRFGLPLEIVPEQDPFKIGAGGTLKLQVLFKGVPQQGVTVEYRGKKVTTNNNGIAFITLGQGKQHIIESEYSIPSRWDAAADEIGYASSLTIDKGR